VLADARGRTSYVTSAGSGPSVGRHLLFGYLPADQARAGNKLAVEYLGEQYPVTVAVAGSTPLFDPRTSGSGAKGCAARPIPARPPGLAACLAWLPAWPGCPPGLAARLAWLPAWPGCPPGLAAQR